MYMYFSFYIGYHLWQHSMAPFIPPVPGLNLSCVLTTTCTSILSIFPLALLVQCRHCIFAHRIELYTNTDPF